MTIHDRHNTRIKDAAVDSALNAIAMGGLDGKLFYVNQAFVNLWGLTKAEDAIGRSALEFWQSPQEAQAVIQALMQVGHWQGELHALHADGSTMHVQLSANLVKDELGNPLCMMASFLDISVQKQTEQQLQKERDFAESLINTAPVIILLLDKEGYIRHANPYFEQLSGYRLEEIVDKNWFYSFLPEREQPSVQSIFDSITSNQKYQGYVNPIITRSNGERQIEWYNELMLDEDGEVSAVLAIGQDVTERKQNEIELAEYRELLEELVAKRTQQMQLARDEAQRANAAKSEFLSRMSHELRTPLNAILGFAQLLESSKHPLLSEMQADSVNEILSSGRHLLSLVNEVLDLSRIESGQLKVTLEACHVDQLIQSSIAQIQTQADLNGISIVADPCDVDVLADHVRLKQVLLNLLSNAVKYNRKDGAVKIFYSKPDAKQFRINIQDTGFGIEPEFMSRLFKPFERHESAYNSIEGTGIGLALAKKMVEAMHGTMGVDSEAGEGSTFWFELPLADKLMVADEQATQSEPLVRATLDRKFKILCIEDNLPNLRLIKNIFSRLELYEFIEAEEAIVGIELAVQEQPDLILLDINLPDIDGFEALCRLRSNSITRDIPVFAVTANAMSSDIQRGKAAGFAEYITKPINVKQLLRTVDQYIP